MRVIEVRSPVMPKPPERWSVYLVRTASGALYTGISTDVDRRFEQHANGRGAKALRGRGPLELVYRVAIGDRAAAQRIEYALKQLSKAEKEAIVVAQPKRRRWTSVLRAKPVHARNAGRAGLRIALGIALVAVAVLCVRWCGASDRDLPNGPIEPDRAGESSKPALVAPNAPNRMQGKFVAEPDSPQPAPSETTSLGELVVEVVDADGVAAQGVPVSVRALDTDDRVAADLTDSRGRATLRFDGDGLSEKGRLRVGTTWISSTPPGIEFGLDSIPTGISRFVLAPSGSVELALVGSEAFALDPDGYFAMHADDDACAAERVRALHDVLADCPLDTRSIVIPYVGLNMCFSARAYTADLEHEEAAFEGPTTAGERVRVELRFAGANVRVTGRAIDDTGAPLADHHVGAYRAGEGSASYGRELFEATTGPDGRFVAYADPDSVRTLPNRLAAEAKAAGHPDRTGKFAWPGVSHPLPVDVITTVDVGDLRFESEPFLASGHVVDASGRPRQARVRMRVLEPNAQDDKRWFDLQESSGKDGSFEVSTPYPIERFELRAFGFDWSPSEVVRAERGARDVLLVLRNPCRIEVTFQVQAGVDASTLIMDFDCIDSPDYRVGGYETYDDGRVVTPPVIPGVYGLTIWLEDRQIATREIDLRTDCSAGKLAPIDLRELLHPIRVTVATSASTRLEDADLRATSGDWTSNFGLTREGTGTITAPAKIVDVVVSAPDCLTRRFEGVVDGTRLELLPGIPVELRVADFPGMPAGETIEVELAPAEGNPMSGVARRTLLPLDERGTARAALPCDGRFTVLARIREKGRRDDIPIPVIRPAEVEIRAGAPASERVIELDMAVLRAELEELRGG